MSPQLAIAADSHDTPISTPYQSIHFLFLFLSPFPISNNLILIISLSISLSQLFSLKVAPLLGYQGQHQPQQWQEDQKEKSSTSSARPLWLLFLRQSRGPFESERKCDFSFSVKSHTNKLYNKKERKKEREREIDHVPVGEVHDVRCFIDSDEPIARATGKLKTRGRRGRKKE